MILRINDRIRNTTVEFWNSFTLDLKYDSVASTFSFNGYFNPDNLEHKELFCIGHYHVATIEHNGELLLTGYILSEGFSHTVKREPIQLSGYSLPGVLEDCEIPRKSYPLELENLSLKEIAQKYLALFGLKMAIDNSVNYLMNTVIPKTTASESQNVKAYLTELCAQRNIVMTHDAKGVVLFTKAKTDLKPILNYGEEGGAPFTKMSLSFNGQGMHSHITVMKQVDADGGNSGESEVRNPYVPFVYRPKVVVQSSGDDVNTEDAAKNVLAAELKNIRLTIETDRWEVDGKIIKPNNLITVINPEVYLYKKSTWFIESIQLKGDNKKTTATLNCVLPEVYNGKTPTYLFKGINLH